MGYFIGFLVGVLITCLIVSILAAITFNYDGYLIVSHDPEADVDEIYAEFNHPIDFKRIPFVNLKIKYKD